MFGYELSDAACPVSCVCMLLQAHTKRAWRLDYRRYFVLLSPARRHALIIASSLVSQSWLHDCTLQPDTEHASAISHLSSRLNHDHHSAGGRVLAGRLSTECHSPNSNHSMHLTWPDVRSCALALRENMILPHALSSPLAARSSAPPIRVDGRRERRAQYNRARCWPSRGGCARASLSRPLGPVDRWTGRRLTRERRVGRP